jgi:hypothetical protein
VKRGYLRPANPFSPAFSQQVSPAFEMAFNHFMGLKNTDPVLERNHNQQERDLERDEQKKDRNLDGKELGKHQQFQDQQFQHQQFQDQFQHQFQQDGKAQKHRQYYQRVVKRNNNAPFPFQKLHEGWNNLDHHLNLHNLPTAAAARDVVTSGVVASGVASKNLIKVNMPMNLMDKVDAKVNMHPKVNRYIDADPHAMSNVIAAQQVQQKQRSLSVNNVSVSNK